MSMVDQVARQVILALEECGVPYMLVGAYSCGAYAIPRSTKDVDIVLSLQTPSQMDPVMAKLDSLLEFDPQITFETITGSLRHILRARSNRSLQVEFFLLGEDPFIVQRFRRRVKLRVPALNMDITVPTAEDVVVQKLRWGRSKDIEDARDVLAIQSPINLDMEYVRHWCGVHCTLGQLDALLKEIEPML